jgi:DNA invertase Pin-like site-specific DNA recombinase
MRAATYARLSDDGLSIPDQQCECRRYAQDRSWEVVGEFKDESRSAFRKVEREGFEALLAAANAGKST